VNSFAAWMTVSRSCLVAGHLGEADNVCEKDGHVLHGVHVERAEDGADIALQQKCRHDLDTAEKD
jgi:hypothetical protein